MVKLDQQDGVWILRMQDGENRFNADSVDELHAALDHVEKAGFPTALVTTGHERFYSNGLDLAWMGSAEADGIEAFFSELYRLFARVLSFPAFTVCAINGHAFGAGAQLAVAHDHQLMRQGRGYFCMPELDMKAPLPPQMIAILAARLPTRTVHQVITTGRRYTAEDAVEAGIVDGSAPEDELLSQAVAVARPFADKDGPTMSVLKRGLHAEALRVLATPPGPTGGL